MLLLDEEQLRAAALRVLGLGATPVDLSAPEALAASIRRTAAILAPCAPRSLRVAVARSLRGLVSTPPEGYEETIEALVDALTAYGDLHELTLEDEATGRSTALLYLAPPSFVARESGLVFILGIEDGPASLLPEELTQRIEFEGHRRVLRSTWEEDLPARLSDYGLIALPEQLWLRRPRAIRPHDAIAAANRALVNSGNPGEAPAGLTVIDPTAPVTFYKGRWTSPRGLAGRFVGRRDQAYGAPLWCYVELAGGRVERVVDFRPTEWRACDQAWHLQMAVDAAAGRPQQYEVSSISDHEVAIDCFSPLPGWAQRRLEVIGRRIYGRRALLSYAIALSEVGAERAFLKEALWLQERG